MSDTFWIVTGVVVVILAIALLPSRRFSGKLGQMEVTLDSINRATNHQPDGGITMAEQVRIIGSTMSSLRMAVMDQQGQNLGRFETITATMETQSGRISAIASDVAQLSVTVKEIQDGAP